MWWKNYKLWIVVAAIIAFTAGVFYQKWQKVDDEADNYLQQKWQLQEELKELKDRKKIFSDCDVEAKDRAKETLEKRAEFSFEAKRHLEVGMITKADYDYGFRACLRRNGIIEPAVEGNLFE